MAYEKQNFVDGQVLTAEHLNHMEEGIAVAEQTGGAGGEVTQIDFSNFENGSFTETVDGKVITHTVTFDSQGRVIAIDGAEIVWGDA